MGLKRFLFVTDAHGDAQDAAAVNAAVRFKREFRPHYTIASEFFDFRAWRTKAGPSEQDEDTEPDLKAGLDLIESFQPTHYLRGNHCERIWMRLKDSKGRVKNYAERIAADIEKAFGEHACRMLPYHNRLGILRLGHLKFLHGFEAGVGAARKTALTYGSSLFGHVHCIDEASVPGLDRRVARSVGCLCDLDMDYSNKTTPALRHCHGFAYGTIDEKTGDYQVFQAEGINGKFYVASDIRAVA